MWEAARVKLGDWYIVVIALVLIGGGFFSRLASVIVNGTGCGRSFSQSIARA